MENILGFFWGVIVPYFIVGLLTLCAAGVMIGVTFWVIYGIGWLIKEAIIDLIDGILHKLGKKRYFRPFCSARGGDCS